MRPWLAVFVLGGCAHHRTLKRECRGVHIGMPFADAYPAVAAAPAQCSNHRPGTVDEIAPACAQWRPDPPAAVSWESPVVGRVQPDPCLIDIADVGRTTRARVWLEARYAALRNLRLAARLAEGQLGDPDIERVVVVGTGQNVNARRRAVTHG